jgi:hypothetical protein
MEEDKIAKRAEELMKLDSSIDREMARFLARDEAKKDEMSQLFAKVGKLLKGPAEIALVGSAAILTLAASPAILPTIATYMGFGAYLWQRENQNNSLRKLEQQIQRTGANLEDSALNFDEFMELFIQFMEIASKSAIEEKQDYLVNLFVNSVVSSTIPFSGKQTLFRIHSQISLEEIHALKVLYDAAIDAENQGKFSLVPVTKIVEKLGWTQEDAFVTCEALAQLFLVSGGVRVSDEVLEISGDSEPKHYVWRVTALAKRFVQWCTEEVSPEK